MGTLARPETLPEANVPFVATPYSTAKRMLGLADVTGRDVVYDLGSGDGRLPILAAETYGASAVGIEIQPGLVRRARKNAAFFGVDEGVEFRQENLFDADIRDATVVMLYLLPKTNKELGPVLRDQLDPGTRIVSRGSRIGDWSPDRTVHEGQIPLHLWKTPR